MLKLLLTTTAFIVLFTTSAALLTPRTSTVTEVAKPAAPTANQIVATGQAMVLTGLRDPGSAIFTTMAVNGYTVCGTVNARNVFGGYAGNVRFIANPKGVLLEDKSTEFFNAWFELCYNKGEN